MIRTMVQQTGALSQPLTARRSPDSSNLPTSRHDIERVSQSMMNVVSCRNRLSWQLANGSAAVQSMGGSAFQE